MQNSQSNQFYVETLTDQRVAGLLLSDCVYPSELETPRHYHEGAFFGFVLDGAYSENYRNRAFTFEPLSLAFHPPGEAHKTSFHKTGGHIFRIEVSPIWLERMSQIAPSFASPADFRGVELSRLLLKLYQEFRRVDHVSPFAIEGLMLEILAEISRYDAYTQKQMPLWLARVQELLHVHFKEQLSLSEIARTVQMHPAYVARAFRKYFRCTVGDYVRKLRLEFACEQLVASDVPLIEIALNAGFCAQSHFNEFFKREIGVTPREYRRLLRTGKSD